MGFDKSFISCLTVMVNFLNILPDVLVTPIVLEAFIERLLGDYLAVKDMC